MIAIHSHHPSTALYPCWSSLILAPAFFLFSIIFCIAAQPSNPKVPAMNVNTTIWSFLLSRWKQVVKTSFSSASLQIGSRWSRQKARLQLAHDAAAARWLGLLSVVGFVEWEESGMMVLFVKQVHLQNDGGEAANVDAISAKSAKNMKKRFMILQQCGRT